MRTYGFKPVAMFNAMSMAELVELQNTITSDPANRNPGLDSGSIYLYTKAARRKLDAIGWAIHYHLAEAKRAI